jgi:hypothetical protein
VKRVVTAPMRRLAVQEAMTAAPLSERQPCRFMAFARSTQRYRPRRDDRELRDRLNPQAAVGLSTPALAAGSRQNPTTLRFQRATLLAPSAR